ncbi:MAG: multidrug ABC transporter substrate-binding protein [Chloroflexota bacterium]
MTKYLDLFLTALQALSVNRLRTFLTVLGIVIGVGSVIAMVSVGRGANEQITARIQNIGTNLLFIGPGQVQQGGLALGFGSAQTLTYDDAVALNSEPELLSMITAAVPFNQTFRQVVGNGTNWNTRVIGTTPDYWWVRNYQLAAGEFFNQQQFDAASAVAILGADVADQLFPESDPIGQNIRIGQATFRVIGVFARKGAGALGNEDDVVVIPLTTFFRSITRQVAARGGSPTVNTIIVQVAERDRMQDAIEAIGAILRQRHRVSQDDFIIRSQEDMLALANQITGIFTLLLGSIAGISLVVGGIGIMNIMLVSVTERTREIGIRKAVGARRREILYQFLTEAVVVSVTGGLLGILLGFGLSRLISTFEINGQRIPTLVSPDAILLAVGVSAIIGLFFGIYPAARAARLNPIEALRYE